MALKNSRKAKRVTSDTPRLLTRAEIAALRREMKESSIWADAELKRRAQKARTEQK